MEKWNIYANYKLEEKQISTKKMLEWLYDVGVFDDPQRPERFLDDVRWAIEHAGRADYLDGDEAVWVTMTQENEPPAEISKWEDEE